MLAAVALHLAAAAARPPLPRLKSSRKSVYTATRHSLTMPSSAWPVSPLGAALDSGGVEAIEKRLRDSGRFDEVQVRKRYRTLAMDEVALVLLVHEKDRHLPDRRAASIHGASDPRSADVLPDPRLRRRLWLDLWRANQRRRTLPAGHAAFGAAVVGRHAAGGGGGRSDVQVRTVQPCHRIVYGISQRENPHYEIDDRRTGSTGAASGGCSAL